LILLFGITLVLSACPPNRGNVEDAEGGGFGEPGFFAWRESPYGQAPQWGILFIPRDDEHDCDAMIGYDWSDADQDYARINFSKAQDLEWAGDYTNNYVGCGSWYDTDRRCFDGFDYFEGLYSTLQAGSSVEMTSWDTERVRGSWTDDADEQHGFNAVNCGELPYYYWVGDQDEQTAGRPETPDQASPKPGSWKLRFR
jgi:hypothetical protein